MVARQPGPHPHAAVLLFGRFKSEPVFKYRPRDPRGNNERYQAPVKTLAHYCGMDKKK